MNFNYNTLNVNLKSDTRSIEIELNRPEKENAINVEMLFELESLFSWLTSHLEVNAVILKGKGDIFCNGFDQEELKIMSEEKLQKYIVRFQKIVSGMLYLPQTVICDLGEGAKGMGIELSLGADIRIGSKTGTTSFNNLDNAWVPCCGGIGLLSTWVGNANARAWTLSSKKVDHSQLTDKGLLLETYSSQEKVETAQNLLTKISEQAPIARIQAKRSLLESILPDLQRTFEYESIFSFASMRTGDWNKEEDAPFTQARDLARELKKSRQKEDLLI
jgi:enoyl-CoA hydratase/carnithine racemase